LQLGAVTECLTTMISRRRILRGGASLATLLAAHGMIPAWARSGSARAAPAGLSGTEFDLEVARTTFAVNGRRSGAITVNGTLPAPLLRWREGDTVTLRVRNQLDEDTSIHWHGILLPYQMDGVPGLSFPGIRTGETFSYRFPVLQAGTYWYHSHSGLQEQIGHYGPLIIDPAETDPVAFDREHVVVLSDWTFLDPHVLAGRLKKRGDSLNFQQRTLGDLLTDVRRDGFAAALQDRLMWGRMRMVPTDIADVSGATYTYLLNGWTPDDNWTALFEPGERVRLRIINASAMTHFNVRIPGLPMTVVQADGLDVRPIATDEFQIGVAETYDVIVQPTEARAFTLMCESMDRSGYARATLAPRLGMEAPVPPLRERPLLTMADMGMAHHADHGRGQGGGHGGGHDGSREAPDTDHAAHDHGHHEHVGGHEAHAQDGRPSPGAMPPDGAGAAPVPQEHHHPRGPGVDNVIDYASSRLHEPGIGLEDVPHRALAYADLRSLKPNPDSRAPARELELHLTGNMERYMWSFDGVTFSAVEEPIVFHHGERLRLTLVNDTMMPHPIHLHGMFFDVVNGADRDKPRKHTIVVKPAEKLSVDVTADAVGDWAFHCHLLYHMHAGMFQVVSVQPHGAHSGAAGHPA
jgi:CopA family copper-resistance protein